MDAQRCSITWREPWRSAGLKVLLVDLDPQASISQIILSPEAVDVLPVNRSIVAMLGDDYFGSARSIIQPAGIPGVDLVPGSNALSRFNFPEPEKTGALQDSLRDALTDVRSDYDAILCDTPPSLETLAWIPAVAADVALTPTPAEALAVQELIHAGRFLERVRWARNPKLVWLGVVLTMVQPRIAIHEAYTRSLRDSYGDLVLENSVPYNVAFKECVVARQPLAFWKPKGDPRRRLTRLRARSCARRQTPGGRPRKGRSMSKSDALLNRFGTNIAQTVTPRPEIIPTPASLPPDKYEGAIKARTFAEMPVDAIACGPQPRTEFDEAELQRLADSIKRFGQLAPIRIRHDAEQGIWVVLVGERRLRACRLAGLERVRVEFVERTMTEADVLAEQVVENAVRADLKPVEQARAYERLIGAQRMDGAAGCRDAGDRAVGCLSQPRAPAPARGHRRQSGYGGDQGDGSLRDL